MTEGKITGCSKAIPITVTYCTKHRLYFPQCKLYDGAQSQRLQGWRQGIKFAN